VSDPSLRRKRAGCCDGKRAKPARQSIEYIGVRGPGSATYPTRKWRTMGRIEHLLLDGGGESPIRPKTAAR
jgi:hypothetical protein